MKNVVKKLLLILFSTFIGLAGCEIGLRLLGNKFSGSTYIADPLLGWSLRPGAGAWEVDEGVAWSKINSHGFRDRDRSLFLSLRSSIDTAWLTTFSISESIKH